MGWVNFEQWIPFLWTLDCNSRLLQRVWCEEQNVDDNGDGEDNDDANDNDNDDEEEEMKCTSDDEDVKEEGSKDLQGEAP